MRRMITRRALPIAVAVVMAAAASLPRAQSPAFEVASIKPNNAGFGYTTFAVRPGGRFVVTNASVKELIALSYQVMDFQLVGVPGWAESERFDINAKADGELPPLRP